MNKHVDIEPEDAVPTIKIEGLELFRPVGHCDFYVTLDQPSATGPLLWGASAWVGDEDMIATQRRFPFEVDFDNWEELVHAIPKARTQLHEIKRQRPEGEELSPMKRSYHIKLLLAEIWYGCQLEFLQANDELTVNFRPYDDDFWCSTMICSLDWTNIPREDSSFRRLSRQ